MPHNDPFSPGSAFINGLERLGRWISEVDQAQKRRPEAPNDPDQPSVEVLRLRTELGEARRRASEAQDTVHTAHTRLLLSLERFMRDNPRALTLSTPPATLVEAVSVASHVIEDLAQPKQGPFDPEKGKDEQIESLQAALDDAQRQQEADVKALESLAKRVEALERKAATRKRSTTTKTTRKPA